MKNILKPGCLLLAALLVAGQMASAQGSLLKKIKQRTEEEVVNGIFGDKKESNEPSIQPAEYNSQGSYESQGSNQSSGGGMSNTRGGGLTHTPPDVLKNIADAETAFGKESYREARNSVRQALLGVEMEIGQNILDGLPGSVKGLNAVTEEDEVSSMSIGFVGMTIQRTYRGPDQELKITVGNDAVLLSSVNLYMSSAAYSSTDDQDYKQVKLKGYPGILEYDDYSGYKLSVPFGQSSIFIAGGINFASEQEIMSAAEEFDIEKIKNELGEK